MRCLGRQLGMNGSAARKEHPEDMAARRAARRRPRLAYAVESEDEADVP
jgi:hypothetical protein